MENKQLLIEDQESPGVIQASSVSTAPSPANDTIKTSDVFLMTLFVVANIVSALLDKRVSIAAPEYPFAKAALTGLAGATIYPLLLLFQYWQGSFTASHMGDRTGGYIACVVGLLFTCYNTLSDLGNRGNVIPGPVVIIMAKLVVPVSVLIEKLPYFRRVHRWTQYGGVLLIMVGVIVTLVTDLSKPGLFNGSTETTTLYLVLLGVASIPFALGVALAGKYLRTSHMSSIYFWWLVSVFELFALIPFSFVNAYVQGLSVSEIGPNLAHGLGCNALGLSKGVSDANDCSLSSLFYWLALPFGFTLNICIPIISRRPALGAPIVFVLRAVALPITVIAFTFPFLMGQDASDFEWEMVLGALVVCAALVLFIAHDIRQCLKRKRPGHTDLPPQCIRSIDERTP